MKTFGTVLLMTLLLTATLASGQGKGKGKGHGQGQGQGHAESAPVSVFRSADRTEIVGYYRSQPGGLPPGLAKRNGDLPPGLQKQLRRNGKLPPGLEKKLVPFPAELESRLPPCPREVRRGMVGGVAVMWNQRTGLIVDASVLFGM